MFYIKLLWWKLRNGARSEFNIKAVGIFLFITFALLVYSDVPNLKKAFGVVCCVFWLAFTLGPIDGKE